MQHFFVPGAGGRKVYIGRTGKMLQFVVEINKKSVSIIDVLDIWLL